MSSDNRDLPPHWLAADDQMRADLRESQKRGRESQERMWRRAGYSEAAIDEKLAQHDQRMAALHETMQSGLEGRAPNLQPPAAKRPEATPPPVPAPPAPRRQEPPREAATPPPPPPRREPVEPELPPAPGRASRWLTGYYRYGVGVLAGTVVAVVVWLVLQAAGAAFLGMAMWSWPSMLLAGLLPAGGLLWWVLEVRSEVRHYIHSGGRVPVRFRRW